MKKLLAIMGIIMLLVGFCSCKEEEPENNSYEKYEKYEKPQTAFLKTGKPLTPYQECIKYIIDHGTFEYNSSIDGIGYRYDINENGTHYAFYCVSTIYLMNSTTSGRTTYAKYIKLDDTSSTMDIVYRITYKYQNDFYGIITTSKETFNENTEEDFAIYRGYIRYEQGQTKESINKELLVFGDTVLKEFNEYIGSKAKFNLNTFGYKNY